MNIKSIFCVEYNLLENIKEKNAIMLRISIN